MIWKLYFFFENFRQLSLDDASRSWYFSATEEMLKLGCKQSKLDKSLFIWYENGKLQSLFFTHVDDFLSAGSYNLGKSVLDKIMVKCRMGKLKSGNFKSVDTDIIQSTTSIRVQPDFYISESNTDELYSLRVFNISVKVSGKKQQT